MITPVYNPPTRPPKIKVKPTPPTTSIVVPVDRPCDDEDCFESSGSDPLASTDEPIHINNNINEEVMTSTESTSSMGSSTSSSTSWTSSSSSSTTTWSSTWTATTTTRPTSTRIVTTAVSRTYPTPRTFPTPPPHLFPLPSPATPRIRVRPTPPDILDKLWNKNQEREEMERKKELEGTYKFILNSNLNI